MRCTAPREADAIFILLTNDECAHHFKLAMVSDEAIFQFICQFYMYFFGTRANIEQGKIKFCTDKENMVWFM